MIFQFLSNFHKQKTINPNQTRGAVIPPAVFPLLLPGRSCQVYQKFWISFSNPFLWTHDIRFWSCFVWLANFSIRTKQLQKLISWVQRKDFKINIQTFWLIWHVSPGSSRRKTGGGLHPHLICAKKGWSHCQLLNIYKIVSGSFLKMKSWKRLFE